MIRAVFFDFYSVWSPDKFMYYQAVAEQTGPEVSKQLSDTLERYFHGEVDLDFVANVIKLKLAQPEVSEDTFKMRASDISLEIIELMRNLHAHFLKLGILANLGKQEYELLNEFNEHNNVFEVISSPLSQRTDATLLSQTVIAKALQDIGEPPA